MPRAKGLRGFLAAAALALGATACDDDGTSPQPLPSPTGLAAQQLSPTSIGLTWNAVVGAQRYAVRRAAAACATPGAVFGAVGAGLTTPQYDDAAVTLHAPYCYRVAAIAGNDTGAFSSGVGFATNVLSGNITTNRTLSNAAPWLIQGYVKVQSGAALTIQPGTRLVGDTSVSGSSLWILRGAKILANGTANEPIVFTSQRAASSRKPGDWGGIVIVGNGIINRTGTVLTEGPGAVAETYSGGSDNADSSGVLRYVRIEFAGYDISGGNASELNGLSLYAVGSRTVLEYVQVVAGLDDSFEWWGGAVDGRYLLSYEAGDDHFDWSEGYVGRNQFLIAFQAARLLPATGSGTISTDPQGLEADGCQGAGCGNGFRSTPYSDPTFANLTVVGSGSVETQASGGFGAVLRRGTKGLMHNVIVARWKGTGLTVRDSVTGNILAADSLNVHNAVFAENTGTGGDYDPAGTNFGQAAAFTADNHRTAATATSLFGSLTPTALNWTPANEAASGCGTVALPATRAANFFGGTMPNTGYCGAVDPAGPQWYQGWTVYTVN